MLKSGGWDNNGAFSMCDYSLHNVMSRPAKVGDKLTTHQFSSGTTGFAAPEDAKMAVCTCGNRACLCSESKLSASMGVQRETHYP
jgi:hypothetical protein